MDLDTAITGRRAIREYTDEPVDDVAIRRLIQAAVQAPSAVNEQPWAFTVVRDAAVLDRISREAKGHMLATLAEGTQENHFREHLADPQFHIFYHAPALVVICAKSPGPWITEDCALAAENLMLAAHAEGLGTCWIGFAQAFLNTPEGKALLALPSEWVCVAPLIVGHPRLAPAPVPRREAEIRWLPSRGPDSTREEGRRT